MYYLKAIQSEAKNLSIDISFSGTGNDKKIFVITAYARPWASAEKGGMGAAFNKLYRESWRPNCT
jgi:hypothetical protein